MLRARRRWRFGAAAAVSAFLLGAAGCGESGSEEEREAILRVLDRARDAVVAGRAEDACATLTAHGEVRARNYGRPYEDTPSCRAALTYFIREDRHPMAFGQYTDILRVAEFEVVEVDGDQARARVRSRHDRATIELRRESGEWRIHDSDVVPEGD